MLESLTIFSKGGLVLYQYQTNPSLVGASDGAAHTGQVLNEHLIRKILTDSTLDEKTYHIVEGITMVWKVDPEFVIAALYPDILFEGPRQYLKTWCQGLVEKTLHEYKLFHQKALMQEDDEMARKIRPDPALFEKTFQGLLGQSKGSGGG